MDKHKIQSDIEKKSAEIQEKTLTGPEKKLWAYKYGKGVGHQLVSFIKSQSNQPTIPLPKYAMASQKNKDTPRENIIPRAPLRNATRHRQMLQHLQGLKEKNDEIQNNIQKAINVIEAKMIDLLSAPGDSSSVEAFDIMEKEITNVLSMMKFSSKGGSRKSTPKSGEGAMRKSEKLEYDFNTISDQLFKKLERIIDSERSKGTTSTSDSSDRKGVKKIEKNDTNNKLKSSIPNKDNSPQKIRSTSVTSTSLEENSKNVCNFAKRSNQSRGRIVKKSKMGKGSIPVKPKRSIIDNKKFVGNLSHEEHTIENIERVFATGECYEMENTNKSGEKAVYYMREVNEDCDETYNSRGDCMKQDDNIKSFENILVNLNIDNKVNKLMQDAKDINSDIPIEDGTKGESIKENDEDKKTGLPNSMDHQSIFHSEEPTTSKDKVTDFGPSSDEQDSSKVSRGIAETETGESDPCLSGEVNKIIKRVEDIYSHLEDIQFSNDDHIPVFRDNQVPEVGSQQFLTPFMQAVKDKQRNRPETPTKQAFQRSPSYYNVLSFLDTLSLIQEEKPLEVQIARLCYYSQLCCLPEIFHQAQLEYAANVKEAEKPSCLKKPSDEGKSKNKKVSFLVMKESKSCQVEISPFHETETPKILSQQFSPIQNCTSPRDGGDNLDNLTENFNELEVSKDQLEENIIVLCDKLYQSDHSLETNQISEITNSIKDISEEPKQTDESVTEKSTQVYFQMRTEQTEKYNTEVKVDVPGKKNCEKSQQVSDVSEGSKSSVSSTSDGTPQIQVFYNQSDADIPKLILEKKSLEGFYGHQTILQVKNSMLSGSKTHPKIVVFREVLDTTGLLTPLKNLERFSDTTLIKSNLEKGQNLELATKMSQELTKVNYRSCEENEVFLKSFYAIIYILMFTALNMEYRCT
ncbi:hypothetical protein JTB14_032014 [Gonioctena quinquepunctata]|nr:hypothetical protein JTB14_032014 [Gonioctena quinquepunctata]